jgi:hypothetical protein
MRRRRPDNVAAVALAAKHARIIWALLARGKITAPQLDASNRCSHQEIATMKC